MRYTRTPEATAARVAGAVAVAALLAGCWTVGPGGTAAAATQPKLVTSRTPAEQAALAAAPVAVKLTVNGRLHPSESHVVVLDHGGRAVPAGEPVPGAGDASLRLPIQIADSGEFVIAYHLTFLDGDELIGSWRFSVGTGAPPGGGALADTELANLSANGHEHGIDPVGATLLVIDGLVVLVVLILLRRRPKPGRSAAKADLSGTAR